MSKNTASVQKPTIIIAKPLVLKKEQLYLSSKKLYKIAQPLYKEDVIYESKDGDFLRGEDLSVTVINKLNRVTNTSVTIAKYLTRNNTVVERSSERVANLIGQKNYDILFSALCSVISQELKVRGILALLTLNATKESSSQTGDGHIKRFSDVEVQTDETSFNILVRSKPKKRVKRAGLAPYVAKEEKQIKRVIIHPDQYKKAENLTTLDLSCENSNDSFGNLSITSFATTNTLLCNPLSLIENVDRYTRLDSDIERIDSVEMTVASSPRAGTLFNNCSQNVHEKKQMAKAQALQDWRNCDVSDEDGSLPIHDAVRSYDVDLLIRQCCALITKKKTVDLEVDGDWTPLKMAILKDYPNMTAILLHFGANPLLADSEQKTAVHHAAEMQHAHLEAIVEHCMKYPRKIFEQNEDLWQDSYSVMPDDRLSRLLLVRMCSMCDEQGYTPLMLASKLGNHENVMLLIRIAPTTINKQMPTCGNTALYLAIGAACTDCIERGDKTVVAPNFNRTIEALVSNGADPSIDNHSGSNVNILLTEFNIAPLSTLVANKLTSIKYFDGEMPQGVKRFDKFMLVKNKQGTVDIMEVSKQKPKADNSKKKTTETKSKETVKGAKDKPVIVENILLTPATSDSRKRKSNESGKFESAYKKFVKINDSDKVTKGKTNVVKNIKIQAAKPEKSVNIRQPAKKRIKYVDNTK